MYSKLTVRSFDNFIKLLDKFNFFYFLLDDRREYTKYKKQADKIYAICKLPEFMAMFNIYEDKEKKLINLREKNIKLANIRKNLDEVNVAS